VCRVDDPIRGELPALQQYVCTDGDAERLVGAAALMAGQTADAPAIEVAAEALARLWYTSGTTGCPKRESYHVSSLKRINYGAAPMPVPVLRRAIKVFGPMFRRHDGLTEATQPVTSLFPEEHRLEGSEAEIRRLASAGRPALGVDVRVVDERDRDVKPGEVGQIVVRGPHVMAGYWKLPEATAEALRGGWLHTKDMATVDTAGFIYIVDRKDDLIISGGFNIYPREVEEVLYLHPAVREAVVFGIPDSEWGESVMALVALNDGEELAADALTDHCRQHLASYKKPRFIHFLPELPKSAVGQVLRRELQAYSPEARR
jgi:long-chain acyl-CoA synthetase